MSITDVSFIIATLLLLSQLSNANDTINGGGSITANQTLVSSKGIFELGFFCPGKSHKWYLGIWYKNIKPKTVVWVANREAPLKSISSAELKLTHKGILIIRDELNDNVWSSNSSNPTQNPVAQLLNTGNLVLRNADDKEQKHYLWQSFDYPTDTYLAGMDLGSSSLTGKDVFLSSWRSNEDPAPGDFTVNLDPTGYPQIFTKRKGIIGSRIGPWNGRYFSGTPDISSDPTYKRLAVRKNRYGGFYFTEDAVNKSDISRFTLDPSGVGQRWALADRTRRWVLYMDIPAHVCDTYGLCGAYGSCNIGKSPFCRCLDKFVPRDKAAWDKLDWWGGCVRRTELTSGFEDGFLKYSRVKLPDARNSWYNKSMTHEECQVQCLRNSNCSAYTDLDIRNGGSGCLIWLGDLFDIRDLSADGQDIYIRMALSELDGADSYGKRIDTIMLRLVAVGTGLLGLSLLLCTWKRMRSERKRKKTGADFLFSTDLHVPRTHTETHNNELELPLFSLSTISKATNNFSVENKLGQGGYGPVYKGTLEGGKEIAVKRLSKTSKQGLDEFKNEVICIARLQHRNLVKLLGCCIQGDEKMLIYEYMPNKSLDLVLFDAKSRIHLDWPKRFYIINGIARGLMYLHQDSRLRIIHRDLKAGNILLDSEMNPKISDFGIAKRFSGNKMEDETRRVIGTYGYMSPEYAVRGRFSIKSDVFSFGVLVLEIVSGKRNSSFSEGDSDINLLGHAWKLYKEGRSIELVDTNLQDSTSLNEILRVIHIGLLCGQQQPDDRPSMTSVVSMLNNEVLLPQVNCPGFYTESDKFTSESSSTSSANASKSTNEVTITMLQGR